MLIFALANAVKKLADNPRNVRIPSPTTEIIASLSIISIGSSNPSFNSKKNSSLKASSAR